jgi:hypothetical protein
MSVSIEELEERLKSGPVLMVGIDDRREPILVTSIDCNRVYYDDNACDRSWLLSQHLCKYEFAKPKTYRLWELEDNKEYKRISHVNKVSEIPNDTSIRYKFHGEYLFYTNADDDWEESQVCRYHLDSIFTEIKKNKVKKTFEAWAIITPGGYAHLFKVQPECMDAKDKLVKLAGDYEVEE